MGWVRWSDTEMVEGDDAARIATVTPLGGGDSIPRPYTAEEDAAADALAAGESARLARETTRLTVRAIIHDLQAEKARAQEVIDSTTATAEDRKAARAARRIADAVIDLARFVKDLA